MRLPYINYTTLNKSQVVLYIAEDNPPLVREKNGLR